MLVLVTDQLSCDRLILAGRALADEHQCVLEVQNIARFGNVPDPAAIEHLYRTSLNAGARMTVHYSEDPERSLVQLLADSLPHYVVTGMPGGGSLRTAFHNNTDKEYAAEYGTESIAFPCAGKQ